MDSISNMIIMMKNASLAKSEIVSFPYSKLKLRIVYLTGCAGTLNAMTTETSHSRGTNPIVNKAQRLSLIHI